MKIPKSIEEFPPVVYSWHWAGQAHPAGSIPKTFSGYNVPTDLLKSRFAFAGEVKLTREEAQQISDFLEDIDMFLLDDGELSGQLSSVRGMIQSKLSTEENQ